MHFVALVIGGDISAQLAPYDENIDVPLYRRRVPAEEMEWIREYAQRKGTTLGENLQEWIPWVSGFYGAEAGADDDGLYRLSTYNPASKWDWYVIGGRWAGELISREGEPSDSLPAGEIDWDSSFVDWFPSNIVAEGHWSTCDNIFGLETYGLVRTEPAEWKRQMRAMLQTLPADTPITVIDYHI